MSLTPRAYQERKWGSLPALRRVLEGRSLEPPDVYSSASDNAFDRMTRLIDIALLIDAYEEEVLDSAPSLSREALERDLRRVEEQLMRHAENMEALARQVRDTANALYR